MTKEQIELLFGKHFNVDDLFELLDSDGDGDVNTFLSIIVIYNYRDAPVGTIIFSTSMSNRRRYCNVGYFLQQKKINIQR